MAETRKGPRYTKGSLARPVLVSREGRPVPSHDLQELRGIAFVTNECLHNSRPVLTTSAVCVSEERQRVEGVLIRAADAEFDVPGEPRWSYARIERCNSEASERREHIDAIDVRDQYQRVVPERHVMAAVDEDIECKLSRRLWVDGQVPRAGNRVRRRIEEFAITEEVAARKRAMVGLRRLGLRRTD